MKTNNMKDDYTFTNGQRGAVVKTTKERITIRLDPDIIQWFKDRVQGIVKWVSPSNTTSTYAIGGHGEFMLITHP
ncbi:MAG: hypothetical protein ACI9D5_002760 [Candidatus Endobugula sp.]|jgi:hypothetical protein